MIRLSRRKSSLPLLFRHRIIINLLTSVNLNIKIIETHPDLSCKLDKKNSYKNHNYHLNILEIKK